MNESNKPEARVLSDEWQQRLEAARAALTNYNSVTGGILPGYNKDFYERIVNHQIKKVAFYIIDFDGGTMQEAREWLDNIEAIATELGITPRIEGNYDGYVTAVFKQEKEYEPEEYELAKHFLETGNYTTFENGVLIWHKKA